METTETMHDRKLLTLAELPDVAVPNRSPLRLGAAVFCAWLAALGVVLASLSDAPAWHVVGVAVLGVFGACSLRLSVAVALKRRSRQ